MERERGFDGAMAKEFPDIRVVARQFGMSDRAKSVAAAENILTAHPDLDGIFASTEPSSSGASLALKARGLAGKVKFVAFDTSDAMIEDMKTGVIHATVVQDPFRIGYEAVRTLVDKLHGKIPPKRIDLGGTVVSLENLQTTEIQQLLRPDINKYLQK
jgi:ribose transport system substrate-binding protein